MNQKKLTGIAACAVAGMLTAMTAGAQTGSSMGSTGTSGSMAKMSSADTKFMTEAAQGGMEEVELGKLAATNGSNADVKTFGQRMVDDHSKANDQLKQVAQSKGVTLPTEVNKSQQKDIDKLSKLNGDAFDRAYMKMMVQDHKKDVAEFKKESKSAKDADVKSFASTTLPTLEDHLKMAQDTASKVGGSHTASMSKHTTHTKKTSSSGQ